MVTAKVPAAYLAARAIASLGEPRVLEVLVVVRGVGRGVVPKRHLQRRRATNMANRRITAAGERISIHAQAAAAAAAAEAAVRKGGVACV